MKRHATLKTPQLNYHRASKAESAKVRLNNLTSIFEFVPQKFRWRLRYFILEKDMRRTHILL